MRSILLAIFCILSWSINAQLYFPPNTSTWETVSPASLGWSSTKLDDLDTYLESSGTFAFIILKEGKIAHEKYFGITNLTPVRWNEVSYPVGAVMTGIEVDGGRINLNSPVSTYLGTGWTSAPKSKEDLITVENMMTMSTGLESSDPTCVSASCLQYSADAGTEWNLHAGTFNLLLDVIATNPGYANQINVALLVQDLVNPNNPPSLENGWVERSDKWSFEGTPRSMARFGLLTLARGNWNNIKTVVSNQNYWNAVFNGSSQNPNKSYSYGWWQNGKSSYLLPDGTTGSGSINPNAPSDMISAVGESGQFIDVIPSQDLVIIRAGTDFTAGGSMPLSLHREMWSKITDAININVDTDEIPQVDESLAFPNPFTDKISVSGDKEIKIIRLYDTFGKMILEVENQIEISTAHLPKGLYILETVDKEQNKLVKKMIKN